jgi:hypothetical protein
MATLRSASCWVCSVRASAWRPLSRLWAARRSSVHSACSEAALSSTAISKKTPSSSWRNESFESIVGYKKAILTNHMAKRAQQPFD